MKQHQSMKKHPLALAALALCASAPFAVHAAPTVSFIAPSSGATISEPINQSRACEVSGSRIDRVTFSIRRAGSSTWTTLNTEGDAPFQCNLDPSRFASGDYTLRAVARDSSGASASATRGIRIASGGGDTGGDDDPVSGVSFKAPAGGQTLSGNLYQSSACEAVTSGISVARVRFYLDGTALNADSGRPYQCNLDTRKFSNGSHTLKAVALNSSGRTTGSTQISVNIQNGVTNTPPSVSLTTPISGAKLSGKSVGFAATASDSNGSVEKVDFFLAPATSGSPTPLASKTAAPYAGSFDTTALPNGTYTLMAQAVDNQGAVATQQRSVSISNTVVTPPDDGGSTAKIAAADILTRISGDLPFADQSGYTAQVINTYTSAGNIPESGIHGSTLPNGETLRLGKVQDPAGSGRKAIAFQVHKNDPLTSKGKRSEMSVTPNIEMNKTYWIAYRVYVYDWGNLASGDDALFGVQLHSGDNAAGVGGPSFGVYVTPNTNGRQLRVHSRYNPKVNPSGSTYTVKTNHPSYPIPFGRWTDFVVKFRHNITGSGMLQVWMGDQLIASHTGSLGFDTGHKDYAKFGYYNWATSMGSTARKVLVRDATIVRDPTGSTYSRDQVKALLAATSASDQ
jgi:hypothetical protein